MQYSNTDELKQKLTRHLTIVMRGISVGTHLTATVVKEAKAAENTTSPIVTAKKHHLITI